VGRLPYSGELEAAYAALFDDNDQFREELEIEAWHNLLFIALVDINDKFAHTNLRAQAIESAIAVYGSTSLIVANQDSLNLSVDEWLQLGFKKIAGTEFVYRDNCQRNPYRQRFEDDD